jgi:hypothetical protein
LLPGIGACRGRLPRVGKIDSDLETFGDAGRGEVIEQPDAKRGGQALPDPFLRLRRTRDRGQDAIVREEASKTDKGKRVLATARAGVGAGDEDMHVGIAAIAHVVDEGNLVS